MKKIEVLLDENQADLLQQKADKLHISIEKLLADILHDALLVPQTNNDSFDQLLEHVLDKNKELYQLLA
ncbi:MAG: hypothetical protein KA168_09150 [Chitinophagales bacterium]|jgi:hypothetical protein|nr:hypothetical protein [Chitinophagales bacterium]